MRRTVDYDLDGVVGLRLVDASPADVTVVAEQIGLPEASLGREPDIVIRFVEHLPATSPLRYLGLDDAGFTDDAFIVLRGKYKSRIQVRIPLCDVGGVCEITCESGIPQVPFLTSFINLTALAKGTLPLHAAAFNYNGTGVVVTGWSYGGKTETLLAFMSEGARYVGDEWVYFSDDGEQMFGMVGPMHVWKWHLDHLPQMRKLVNIRERARMGVINALAGGIDRVTARGRRHCSVVTRTLNRLRPVLERQLVIDIHPHVMFGEGRCDLRGKPEVFVLAVSHESPEVSVRPIESDEVAHRMLFSLQEEQSALLSCYWKYRFAFPRAANSLLERSRELQEAALHRVLRGKKAFELRHPYPVPIPRLFDAVSPYLK